MSGACEHELFSHTDMDMSLNRVHGVCMYSAPFYEVMCVRGHVTSGHLDACLNTALSLSKFRTVSISCHMLLRNSNQQHKQKTDATHSER